MGKKSKSKTFKTKQSNIENSSLNRILVTLAVGITSITIFSIIAFVKENYKISTTGTTEKVYQLDQIILLHADFMLRIMEVEQKSNKFMDDNTLEQLIITKLRPIQERYGSILKQTKIYEELMSKNKHFGGPDNFVQTSIKELDEMLQTIRYKLDTQLLPLVNEHKQQLYQCEKATKDMMDLQSSVEEIQENPFTAKTLAQLHLQLELARNSSRLISEKFSIGHVEQRLRKLGNLIQAVNKKEMEIKEMRKNGRTKRHSYKMFQKQGEIDQLKMIIAINIEINKDCYAHTYSLVAIESSRVLRKLAEKIKRYDKLKFPYIGLRDMIIGDILKLKKRISNLMK